MLDTDAPLGDSTSPATISPPNLFRTDGSSRLNSWSLLMRCTQLQSNNNSKIDKLACCHIYVLRCQVLYQHFSGKLATKNTTQPIYAAAPGKISPNPGYELLSVHSLVYFHVFSSVRGVSGPMVLIQACSEKNIAVNSSTHRCIHMLTNMFLH